MDYLYYKSHKEVFSPSCCLLGLWKINADKNYARKYKANENMYVQKTLPINSDYSDYVLVALRTLEGEGSLTLNNITYNLKKDTMIFFKLCQNRMYHSISEKWSFVWSEFLINYNSFDLNSIYNVRPFSAEEAFFDKALEKMSYDNAINTYVSSLFATQLVLWKKHSTKETMSGGLTSEEVINNILSFISVNYSDPYLSVAQLATISNLSERRFRTLFTDIVGQSPKKYITNYRMNIACNLLSNSNMSIFQITAKVGYENQSYFCNAFRTNFKMSPSEYIHENRNLPLSAE